jgi:hypothetical protein
MLIIIMTVSRQCLLLLQVKVAWKKARAWGSEEGKVMGSDSSTEQRDGVGQWGVSFVFGWQLYDETLKFWVWMSAV